METTIAILLGLLLLVSIWAIYDHRKHQKAQTRLLIEIADKLAVDGDLLLSIAKEHGIEVEYNGDYAQEEKDFLEGNV